MNPITLEIKQFEFGYEDEYEYNRLTVSSDCVKNYVKPEEVEKAVVSEPFDFVLFGYHESRLDSKYWSKLFNSIRHLLAPANLDSLENTGNKRRKQMRLVFISAAPLSSYVRKEEQTDADNEDKVEVPVKLKLIPDYFLADQRSDKESSCIVKLATYLQPSALILSDVEASDYEGDEIQVKPSELIWIPEELAWETQTTLLLYPKRISNEYYFLIDALRIGFQLTDKVIAGAIQHEFGFFPHNNSAKRLLEEEINTDLVIVDQYGESIRCHQFPLMSASSRFADMLDQSRGWNEGQTKEIKLEMSKEAIIAMLHFIYYGGAERIRTGSVKLALELLQIGHMYEIQNLVDATTMILMIKPDEQFCVDDAWNLFHFARAIPEDCQGWRDLQKRCCEFIFGKADRSTVQDTEEYQNLLRISTEIGTALVTVLEETEPESLDEAKALPVNFNQISPEECCLLYDCLTFSRKKYYRIASKYAEYSNYALALLLLAEHCNSEPPEVSRCTWNRLLAKPVQWFEVDYLVALFSLVCGMTTGYHQNEWKLKIAEKLKWFKLNKHQKIVESKKYQEMMQKNWNTAMEFYKLFNQLPCVQCKNEDGEAVQNRAD